MPAVFLYSPNFIYIGLKDIKGLSIEHITSPRDRFLNSYLWYTETDNIWKIFSKKLNMGPEKQVSNTCKKILIKIKK